MKSFLLLYYLPFLAQIAGPINYGSGLVTYIAMFVALTAICFGAWHVFHRQELGVIGYILVAVVVAAAGVAIVNAIFHGAGATTATLNPSNVD